MLKTFLLTDDKHPNFYVGRITRRDDEIVPALRELEVGDSIKTSERRGIQRES